MERKYNNLQTDTATTENLELTRHVLQAFAVDEAEVAEKIPENCQQLYGRLRDLMIRVDTVDACVEDHFLFVDDAKELDVCPFKSKQDPMTACGQARYFNGTRRARRQAFYVDVMVWLEYLLQVPSIFEATAYVLQALDGVFESTPLERRDVFTGSVFKEHIIPFVQAHGGSVRRCAYFGMTNDSVTMTKAPVSNLTPVILTWFNAPPWLRMRGPVLFPAIMCPKNCKNYSVYITPLIKRLASLSPAVSRGHRIAEGGAHRHRWHAMLVALLNDIRGMPSISMQVQPPAILWACQCEVRGIHILAYNTTVYPGACRFLSPDNPRRQEYADVFSEWPELQSYAYRAAPRTRTDSAIRAAMAEAKASPLSPDSRNHPCWTYGFKAESVLAQYLPYWDCAKFQILDEDHHCLNLLRDMLALMSNSDHMKLSPDQMRFENKYGRFRSYAPVPRTTKNGKQVEDLPRPPWAAEAEEIQFVDKILPTILRLPKDVSNGGKCPRFFSDTLTFADAQLFFCGLGEVILRLLPSIEDEQREAYLCIIQAVARVYLPAVQDLEVSQFQVAARFPTVMKLICVCFNLLGAHGRSIHTC